MKSIAPILLFPYFLPMVAISAITFAWILIAPGGSNFLGIGSDVVGVFIVFCLLGGVVAQVVIGIPLIFLLSQIRGPYWRGLMAVVAVALTLIPFHGHLGEFAPTLAVIVGFIAVGVWISIRTFHPHKNYQVEGIAPNRSLPPTLKSTSSVRGSED